MSCAWTTSCSADQSLVRDSSERRRSRRQHPYAVLAMPTCGAGLARRRGAGGLDRLLDHDRELGLRVAGCRRVGGGDRRSLAEKDWREGRAAPERISAGRRGWARTCLPFLMHVALSTRRKDEANPRAEVLERLRQASAWSQVHWTIGAAKLGVRRPHPDVASGAGGPASRCRASTTADDRGSCRGYYRGPRIDPDGPPRRGTGSWGSLPVLHDSRKSVHALSTSTACPGAQSIHEIYGQSTHLHDARATSERAYTRNRNQLLEYAIIDR